MIKQQLQRLEQETDLETVLEVIQLFMQSAPNQLREMRALQEKADWEKLSTTAHAMKGNMAYLGSKQGWKQCAKIEAMCAKRSLVDVDNHLKKLALQLEEAFPYLQQVLDTGHIG
ncbi:MAG: Hpt domain-containing protein [Mariprofundaceae bacterium]|nr:Hpt domain-containing protein [Mariprofundaceae bacterium]